MSQEEIIFISDGKLTSCDFCGISFSHKHKVGSLPKEFEVIEDKSKGTEKCCGKCEEPMRNNITQCRNPKCSNCHSPQGDTPEVTSYQHLDRMLETFYNDVIQATLRFLKGKDYGKDPETFLKEQLGHWEENFKKYHSNLLLQAKEEGYKEGKQYIRDTFTNGWIEKAVEQERQEIVDEIEKVKSQMGNAIQPCIWCDWWEECVCSGGLDELKDFITQRGTKSAENNK